MSKRKEKTWHEREHEELEKRKERIRKSDEEFKRIIRELDRKGVKRER